MKRENRYFVFKRADVAKYLNKKAMEDLHGVQISLDAKRKSDGKQELSTIVVESDWPEYELTWKAIEFRVDGIEPQCNKCQSLNIESWYRQNNSLIDKCSSDYIENEFLRSTEIDGFHEVRAKKDHFNNICLSCGFESQESMDSMLDKEALMRLLNLKFINNKVHSEA